MRQSTTLLLLALGSSACARSDAEWRHDLTSPWRTDFDRGLAAIALAEQAPEHAQGAVSALLALLDGPEGPLRPHAAEALRKLAPGSIEELVRVLVRSPFLSEEARIPLEEAIVSAGDRAVRPLFVATSQPGRIGPEQVDGFLTRLARPPVEPLMGIVRDIPGAPMAAHAARVLGDLGPVARPALPTLLEALRAENEDLARAAAGALWRIDADGGTLLHALRAALADPRPSVRLDAAKSLAHVCVVRAAAAEGDEREAALREIVRLGDPVGTSLCEKIASGGPKRERAARECLFAIAARWTVLPPSARVSATPLAQLEASFDDADPVARTSAALELGRMGATASPALPRLARALEDRDKGVRTCAAVALAVIAIDLARTRSRDL